MTGPFHARLGAIDPATGAVVWAPTGVPSEVRALAAMNGALYAVVTSACGSTTCHR